MIASANVQGVAIRAEYHGMRTVFAAALKFPQQLRIVQLAVSVVVADPI